MTEFPIFNTMNGAARWISECCRVLKTGRRFLSLRPSRTCNSIWPAVGRAPGIQALDCDHNERNLSPRKQTFIPPTTACLYYTKGPPRVFNKVRLPIETCRHCHKEIKDYGGHRKKMHPDGVNLTDFWTDTSPNRHKKFKVRPGVNELKLMIPERAILISTDQDDLVFDPFGGGGSTFQAAEMHSRNWLGAETI